MIKRRDQGSEKVKKRELEDYAKNNPEFAAKIKLLEELKAKKAKEEEEPTTAKNKNKCVS